MRKPEFKPEDFADIRIPYSAGPAADTANAWLRERAKEGWELVNVKDGMAVTGYKWKGSRESGWDFSTNHEESISVTHRALLINIEPIEKKPCEHEATIVPNDDRYTWIKVINECKHCGIQLKARWEPIDSHPDLYD